MDYLMLGRSGLAVTPMCLGGMTFGDTEGLGVDVQASERLIGLYLDRGGNFIDTADGYGRGRSEEIIGSYIDRNALRDRIVLATKYSTNTIDPNPNAGGNGRKNMMRALEGSLRRFRTDYIDIYWMHCWDAATPAEEVVYGLDALVRAGKIRYYGFSNAPAWYIARAVSIAERHGMAPPIAMQMSYSLLERAVEREHLPAAQALGLGLCCYSPLAGGALSGKYDSGDAEGRLAKGLFGGLGRIQEDGVRAVLRTVEDIAGEIGRTPAEVSLNWLLGGFPSTAVIVGATKEAQLSANLAALDATLSPDQRERLDRTALQELGTPYFFAQEPLRRFMVGSLPPRSL